MSHRVLTTALLVVTFATTPLMAVSVPAVGSLAPEFTISSEEGKPVSLTDYRGKWVVLYFYPKDFTSGCTIEAHNFQRDQGIERGLLLGTTQIHRSDTEDAVVFQRRFKIGTRLYISTTIDARIGCGR